MIFLDILKYIIVLKLCLLNTIILYKKLRPIRSFYDIFFHSLKIFIITATLKTLKQKVVEKKK